MINYGQLFILILATVAAILWTMVYLKGRNRYADVIASIDGEDYFMSELFFIGFELMNMLGYNMDSKASHKKIKEISEVYGSKYSRYHFYILRGGQFTYGLTFMTISLELAAMSAEIIVAFLGVVLTGLLVYYLEETFNDKLKARREELILDFPAVLSKLTLLVNSGMVMREAWKKVAYGGDRELYVEMQNTLKEMDNGEAEIDAYLNFANRCFVKEIRKFASTMIQNLQKGSSELAMFLKDMSDEMWEEKKHVVKRKGEAAASKLMMPTVLIFIGILILIMVPMLAGAGL